MSEESDLDIVAIITRNTGSSLAVLEGYNFLLYIAQAQCVDILQKLRPVSLLRRTFHKQRIGNSRLARDRIHPHPSEKNT